MSYDGGAANAAPAHSARLWGVAQGVALLSTVAVIVGLFVDPTPTLEVLWRLVIPLVPASLLISPMLWRNVCPLATLEMPSAGLTGKRTVDLPAIIRAAVLGMALLGVLVSARHVLFNGHNASDGAVLGGVVAAVAALALLLGRLFAGKVGFCNTICPVLPVERLYGQNPLLRVPNARCPSCSGCTKVGCLDVRPERSIAQLLSHAPSDRPWFLTHFGAFAAAFPGFVLGYYLTEDGPLSTASTVFATTAMWSAASFAAVATVAGLVRLPARVALPLLGGLAASVYYWFAAPVLCRTLGLDGPPALGAASAGTVVLRALALALIGGWLFEAFRRRPAAVVAAT